MKYIDLHCDTASRMLYENERLKKNKLKVDIEKLKKGGALAQIFAFFIDVGEVDTPFLEFEIMYKNFMNEINKNSQSIKIVKNLMELSEAEKQGKLGAFLSIEDGAVLRGKTENIKKVYHMGIRIITLTWNYKNKLGYPNYNFIYENKGLTDKGIEMVKEMENIGIIPDASHLSDAGFYNLIEICTKPFLVTHSNSRTITNHYRNLTDDMIKKLSNKGGVMGMNFCSKFLGTNRIALIDDIIKHIKHIKNVGGIEVIALGSDFDGINNATEIKDTSEMDKLALRLNKEGFSDDEIEKIFYKNILRVMIENLK